MIKKLKRAAEFLGCEVTETLIHRIIVYPGDEFNPHEETGRHWLVEMFRKLDKEQYLKWLQLMWEEYIKEDSRPVCNAEHWNLIAPSKLCFEKIMETLDNE